MATQPRQQTDLVAETKLRTARARVSYLRPYFSHAIYAYILVQANDCPSLAVDEYMRLYWNPTFVHKYTVDQLAVVLLHEIGHTLREHHRRARSLGVTFLTAPIANAAEDCEINDDLRDEIAERKDLPPLPNSDHPRFPFPANIGCEDNQVWEVYYAHLMDNAAIIRAIYGVVGEPDVSGDGKPEEDSGGQSDSQNGQMIVAMPHDCGSGAHGVKRPWEHGDSREAESVSHADQRDVRRLTAEAIAERQRTRGDVPGGWQEWADAMLRPPCIPWDQELAGELRWSVNNVAGMVFHSYKRPSRRQSAVPDVVLPDMRRPQPFVCIVGDTSASMDHDDLALVRGTAQDICHALGAKVAFLATDANVHGGVQMVKGGLDIKLLGRGGTDMCVGIAYALTQLRPKPDVVVVCTDCETEWPAVQPYARIIVCAINASDESVANIPRWARVIRIHAADLHPTV